MELEQARKQNQQQQDMVKDAERVHSSLSWRILTMQVLGWAGRKSYVANSEGIKFSFHESINVCSTRSARVNVVNPRCSPLPYIESGLLGCVNDRVERSGSIERPGITSLFERARVA